MSNQTKPPVRSLNHNSVTEYTEEAREFIIRKIIAIVTPTSVFKETRYSALRRLIGLVIDDPKQARFHFQVAVTAIYHYKASEEQITDAIRHYTLIRDVFQLMDVRGDVDRITASAEVIVTYIDPHTRQHVTPTFH